MTPKSAAASLLTAMLLGTFPGQVAGKEFSNEAKRKCIEAIEQRTAAFVAQDWEALEEAGEILSDKLQRGI